MCCALSFNLQVLKLNSYGGSTSPRQEITLVHGPRSETQAQLKIWKSWKIMDPVFTNDTCYQSLTKRKGVIKEIKVRFCRCWSCFHFTLVGHGQIAWWPRLLCDIWCLVLVCWDLKEFRWMNEEDSDYCWLL